MFIAFAKGGLQFTQFRYFNSLICYTAVPDVVGKIQPSSTPWKKEKYSLLKIPLNPMNVIFWKNGMCVSV